MPAEVILTSYSPESLNVLGAAIERAKSGKAMNPVTVVAASSVAAINTRRALIRSGHCLVNVEFTSLPILAGRLGEPHAAAAEKGPRSESFTAEALRIALDSVKSPYPIGGGNTAMERAFEATLRDLLTLDEAGLDTIASFGERTRYVVGVAREYKRLVGGTFDLHELVEGAVKEVDSGVATRDLGHVLLFCPTRPPGLFRPLLDALAREGRLTLILGATGDRSADAPMMLFADELSGVGHSPGGNESAASNSTAKETIPTPRRIVTVPDAEEEVRWVARDLLRRCRAGARLSDMAVLYPSGAVYPRLVADIFSESGIPSRVRQSRTLLFTSAGNALAGALRIAGSDYRRDEVAAWLNRSDIANPEDRDGVSVPQWDLISRRAGVVKGAEEWQRQLARYSRSLRERARRHTENGDSPEMQARLGEAEESDRLAGFVAGLVSRTALLFEEGATWSRLADCATSLVEAYAKPGDDPDEVRAREIVEERISGLRSLDKLEGRVDLSIFIDAVEEILSAPAPQSGKESGVFVDTIARSAGCHFAVAYIMGMTESAVPARPSEDPLLTDADRVRSGALIPTSHDRAADERRDFLAVVAASDEVILLHPCGDIRKGREVMPSRWLVEAATALSSDGDVYGSDLVRPESLGEWHERVLSFTGALAGGEELGSLQEYHLAILAANPGEEGVSRLLATTPAIRRGAQVYLSRFSSRYDEFTGLVGRHPALDLAGDEPVSTTAIETWAGCPYKYFLSRVLRVSDVETPEEIDEISPLDFGSLVHEILEAIVNDYGGVLPEHWPDNDLRRAARVAERVMAEYENDGATGRQLLWDIRKGQLKRSLPRLLAADADIRRAFGTKYSYAEYDFGTAGSERPTSDFVVQGGRTVRFRGKIDRVDLSSDGKRAAVFDYKTGSVRNEKALHEIAPGDELVFESSGTGLSPEELDVDFTLSGQRLQLFVYAQAATDFLGVDECAAFYWFIPRDGLHPRLFGYKVDDFARSRFGEVLSHIDSGISGGVFPLNPGEEDAYLGGEGSNCTWCEYDAICPTGRLDLFERKSDDPVIEPLLALHREAGSDE